MRTMNILKPACGVALCGILLGGAVRVQGRHASLGAGDPVLAAPRQPAPPSLPAAPRICNQTGDEDRAWCEFNALTTATKKWPAAPVPPGQTIPMRGRPLWSDWTDKCGVGINSGACPPPDITKQNHPELGNDVVHISPPVQGVPRSATEAQKSPLNLSSVLFSPDLGDVIKGLATPKTATKPSALDAALSDAANQTGMVHVISPGNTDLKPYATAIKLIWEIVSPNDATTNPAFVYVPASDPHAGPNSVPPQLKGLNDWQTRYSLDPDENVPCDPDGTGLPTPNQTAPTIHVNCFYHYVIDTTDQAIVQQIAQNCANIVPCTQLPSSKQMLLILVGMHVMVFTPERPNWQWMTFYWTPALNGRPGWQDPWRHYQMLTTSSIPSADGDPRHDTLRNSAPVANPYLEGHIDSLNTNCVSCHSMAVYSALPVRRGRAIDVVDAQELLPGPGYPATEITAVRAHYFDHVVLTHFIWSLANFHPEPQPAAQRPPAGAQHSNPPNLAPH